MSETTTLPETNTTAAAEPVLRLERDVCGRCGGSGHYSYCSMYGTTCFQCLGRKECLTKRGARAAVLLKELRSRPVSELRVGDTIRCGYLTGAGNPFNAWAKVTAIVPDAGDRGGRVGPDGKIVVVPGQVHLETKGKYGEMHHTGCLPTTMYEVLLPKEEQRATLVRAIAFQNALAKNGRLPAAVLTLLRAVRDGAKHRCKHETYEAALSGGFLVYENAYEDKAAGYFLTDLGRREIKDEKVG